MNLGDDGEWIATLGRQFLLGSLYNYRNDNICDTRSTFWRDQTPITSKHFISQFEIIAEDSLTTIARCLDIKESQKLSLFGGLIDNFSGSAKYLYDYRFSKRRAQVALRYWCTSHKNQLNLDTLLLPNDSLPSLDVLATHVTTGILYGAEAIFLFHKNVDRQEDYHTVYKQLRENVLTLRNALEASSDIDEIARHLFADQADFTYYGDIPFQHDSAVEFCKTLLSVGEDSPILVPKQVCLHPLSRFHSNVPNKCVKAISTDLVIQTESLAQDLYEIETNCNGLLKKDLCQYFPVIEQQLSCFNRMIARHKNVFLDSLAELLPRIRGGEEEEIELVKLFEKYHNSPFYPERLRTWLKDKEYEISLLAHCLEELSKIPGKHYNYS